MRARVSVLAARPPSARPPARRRACATRRRRRRAGRRGRGARLARRGRGRAGARAGVAGLGRRCPGAALGTRAGGRGLCAPACGLAWMAGGRVAAAGDASCTAARVGLNRDVQGACCLSAVGCCHQVPSASTHIRALRGAGRGAGLARRVGRRVCCIRRLQRLLGGGRRRACHVAPHGATSAASGVRPRQARSKCGVTCRGRPGGRPAVRREQ